MKKKILVLLIVTLAGINCFAQRQSAEARALQGTWILIGGLHEEGSFNEQDVKAENLNISYVFSGDTFTVRKNGEVIGPLKFEPVHGTVQVIDPETGTVIGMIPYNLQGRILIFYEGGFTYIYRKR